MAGTTLVGGATVDGVLRRLVADGTPDLQTIADVDGVYRFDLAAHHLPAGALQVEVTERVLMEASNSALTGLKLLRAAGVKVGLDDFGTGYSSLSYLRMFPLGFVKIDGSFVHGLVAGATERAIVASIIDLSHALGMAVVAEGVETEAQADQLVDPGCDRAQGFYYAPPGPSELVEDRVLGTAPPSQHTDHPSVARTEPAAHD
jgi:EAL domain-containing protein (putative c-di-GMP-specific phosphodiesterase class I)